jgi:hypothetical protein
MLLYADMLFSPISTTCSNVPLAHAGLGLIGPFGGIGSSLTRSMLPLPNIEQLPSSRIGFKQEVVRVLKHTDTGKP